MKEDIKDDWVYLRDLKGPLSQYHFIHCDTRDFYIKTRAEDEDYLRRWVAKYLYEEMPDSYITTEELLPWLESLEEASGGKGRWRCLTFRHDGRWLKYIRFARLEGGRWFVYTTCGDDITAVNVSKCQPDMLETDDIICKW